MSLSRTVARLALTLPLLLCCFPAAQSCHAAGSGPLVIVYTARNEPAASDPIRLELSCHRHQLGVYRGATLVKQYPVAVGRSGWETPLGDFQIFQMVQDPNWK